MVKRFNQQFKKGQGDTRETTSDITLDNGDFLVLVDATAGPITITLFKAVGWGGKQYCIKKTDSSTNQVTINPVSGETIDGATSKILSKQHDVLDIISDNENYNIIAKTESPIITIVKKSDQTINSEVALQDVTDLVYVLKPNTRYYVLITARMISPSAADMDLSFTVIAGTDYAQFRITMGTGNLVNFGTEALTSTSGSNQSLFLPAWFKTGSGGGTLQFQFAQNVSDAGDTKILEGSLMTIYELV